MENLDFQYISDFMKTTRKFYFYESTETNEFEFGGYFKKLWPLHYLVVRNAGHFIAVDNIDVTK